MDPYLISKELKDALIRRGIQDHQIGPLLSMQGIASADEIADYLARTKDDRQPEIYNEEALGQILKTSGDAWDELREDLRP